MIDPLFLYLQEQTDDTNVRFQYGPIIGAKYYERCEQIELPTTCPNSKSFTLDEAFSARKTTEDFASESINLDVLGCLLYETLACRPDSGRGKTGYSFPSGGAKYPVETYVLVYNCENLDPGIYHYYAPKHTLSRLPLELPKEDDTRLHLVEDMGRPRSIDRYVHQGGVPGVYLSMTLLKEKASAVYGGRVYMLGLIEAGHRAQNIVLKAADLDIGALPLGSMDYEFMNEVLGIDGNNEHYIYTVGIGNKK